MSCYNCNSNYRMGAAYIGLGKFKEAKVQFKKVLEKMPNDKY